MKQESIGRFCKYILLLISFVICAGSIAAANDSDDQYWHMMVPPESGFSSFVNALTVFHGEVIAAGVFSTAGTDTLNSIARWDGKKWRPMGPGMDAPIWCLAVYKGDLIAGGEFKNAGGVAANGIARWDGTVWQPLGFGVRGSTKDEWVHVTTMTEFKGDLIVGGRFSFAGRSRIQSMARWNGREWLDISYEIAGDVKAVTVYHGQLVATGDISEPSSGTVIQYFDGVDHWSVLGKGEPDDEVDALFVHGDSLIVAGKFSKIAGVEALGVASWDGTSWGRLSVGLGQNIWCLGDFDGRLVAAGANGAVASWNGSSWESLGTGTNGDISSLLEFDHKLIVAGGFTRAGQVRAARIAVWDKSTSIASDNDK